MKYFNDAIIGNKVITASYSYKGELLRMYYPTIGYKQFIDFLHIGIKVNNSNLIYLHDDVNNKYNQYYLEDTNILNTEIENTYFKLKINQIDFVQINDNNIIKKYEIENCNSEELDISFLIRSKLISETNETFGSKVLNNGIMQYSHNYKYTIISKSLIQSHQLNDLDKNINSGNLEDKDYIGMSSDCAIKYNLGIIKPGETKQIEIFINISSNEENFISDKLDFNKELSRTRKYWKKYVQEHTSNKSKVIKNSPKIEQIYKRSILLFPLLTNQNVGGIASAVEVDENKEKSGGYSYCWTRDAVFMTKAFDLLKMNKETEKFYKNFCKITQNKDGMWEQRFFCNGNLAPCWGYQIDETASVIYGIYEHYKICKDIKFLKDTLKMCEMAMKFLFKYVEATIGLEEEEDFVKKELDETYKNVDRTYKHLSYDLWEMNEGIHLYSLSSIFASFDSMKKIYEKVNELYNGNRIKQEKISKDIIKLEKYQREIKNFVLNNMYNKETKLLYRNDKDNFSDISILGSVEPFNMFKPKEKKVLNTVDKMNLTLRTYTGGYLRFEKDSYMGGKNPWTVATLWMALYYKKVGNRKREKECLEFIAKSANKHGFLSEQVDNKTMTPNWVTGLGWAHAMFVVLLLE